MAWSLYNAASGSVLSRTWAVVTKTTEARGTQPALPRLRVATSVSCWGVPGTQTKNAQGWVLPLLGAHWAARSRVSTSVLLNRCVSSYTLGLQRDRSGSARPAAVGWGARSVTRPSMPTAWTPQSARASRAAVEPCLTRGQGPASGARRHRAPAGGVG